MKGKEKEIVHIYVRCSQRSQDVTEQINQGIKYSKKNKMDYRIYNDKGLSGIGSYEEKREELQNLLWEIEMGYVKHIWVETYDRLTRNFEDSIHIDKLIIENELKVYEGLTNKFYEPSDSNQQFVRLIQTYLGTREKLKESQKSIQRKIEKWKNGDWCRGNIPFGYHKVDKKLKIKRSESKWVKRIFTKFSEGESLEDIRNYLNSYGVKSKRGNDWSSEGVGITLRLPEYIGKSYYTDMTKDPHRRNKKRYPYPDESKWVVYPYPEDVPRIVSDELYDMVQKRMTKQKLKPTKNEYFLHGKLECDCGCQWVGRMKSRSDRGKPPEFYYYCSNNDKWYHRNRKGREHLHKEGICNKPKRINTSELDELVWNKFIETLSKSSFLKEKVKNEVLGTKYQTSSSRKKINRDMKRLRGEISQLNSQRTKLLKDKYTLQISEKDFNDIDLHIGSEIRKHQEELDKVRVRENFLERRSEWLDWVSHFNTEIKNYLNVTDMKKRRRILDSHVTKIMVKYYKETQQHDVKIHFKIPLVNDGIEYVKNSDSKMKWDKWGNSYRVKRGDHVVSLSTLNRSNIGVGKDYSTVTDLGFPTPTPFLSFNLRVLTHQFVYRRKLENSHQKTHDKILELKNQGLGYRKISKELNRLGYKSKTGKGFYPSLISVMWKKIEKKQRILNQPITNEYSDFNIQMIQLQK